MRWSAGGAIRLPLTTVLLLCVVAFFTGLLTERGRLAGERSADASSTGLAPGGDLAWSLGLALARLRAGEARLLYYHVPKSGGTSMCNAMVKAMAPLMGCTDENRDRVVADETNLQCNCNGHRDTLPPIFATASTAEGMEAYLRRYRPAAFFNEHGVADAPYWGPMLVHAIVVRHPVRRYVSHIMHVVSGLHGIPLEQVDTSQEVLQVSASGRSRGKRVFIPDNFLTRYLGGYSSKAAPTVTAEHYRAALRNLERMQVVLVLEEMYGAAELLKALGLRPFGSQTRAGSEATAAGKHEGLTPAAQRRLEQLHKWDLKLYSWCLRRHRATLEAYQASL